MTITRRKQSEDTERGRLADELAGLRAEVKALREERSNVAEVSRLRREVATLEIQKDKLTEDNARAIRETEHKTGLLRSQVEAERQNAETEAKLAADRARLEVQKDNLAADKQRFADEMTFQREHLQREVTRIEDILAKVLERLPNIDAALTGTIGQPKAGTAKPPSTRKGGRAGDDVA